MFSRSDSDGRNNSTTSERLRGRGGGSQKLSPEQVGKDLNRTYQVGGANSQKKGSSAGGGRAGGHQRGTKPGGTGDGVTKKPGVT